ncbi:hypothetical protein GRS66_008698 [Saccharomyces pastorianus]|uniref:Uncharacterized protein n=1 Tax=Saccharomyces pastorianus TaxID=27292 RepID=A0A6C1E9S8_SACPS|nr:hypothetical protein GRS66_008698 [Saccharomyces pastorianus]
MRLCSSLLSQNLKSRLVVRPSTTIHASDPFSNFIVTRDTEPLSLDNLQRGDSVNRAVVVSFKNTALSKVTDLQKKQDMKWDPVKYVAGRLRGIISPIQAYISISKRFSSHSLVYDSRFFQLHYFPEDHFISCFRKSKPSITVKSTKKFYLNGKVLNQNHQYYNESRILKTDEAELTKIQTTMARLASKHRNNIPSEFAYLRRDLKLKVKTPFIEEWCRLNGDKAIRERDRSESRNAVESKAKKSLLDKFGRSTVGTAKDGYYLYIVRIFPDVDTLNEFNKEINKSVQKVADLNWDKFLIPKKGPKGKTWVEAFNDSINVNTINRILKISKFPFELRREQSRDQ